MTSKQMLADISYLVLLEIDTLKHKEIWRAYFKQIEKDLEVLEMLKTHFKVNGFDKLIPNGEWFDLPDEDRNKIFKEFGDDK